MRLTLSWVKTGNAPRRAREGGCPPGQVRTLLRPAFSCGAARQTGSPAEHHFAAGDLKSLSTNGLAFTGGTSQWVQKYRLLAG